MGIILKNFFDTVVVFSCNIFSFFLLPMVIFAAGYNLQKKNFFRYSSYIVSLGVLGTVLTFLFIYYSSDLVKHKNWRGESVELTARQRIIMASVLSSTDTVAPMAFLPAESFPRLYAVVFGEGVLNDVMSILLSDATAHRSEPPIPGVLLGDILYFCSSSLAMGLAFGLGTSSLFKHAKSLHQDVLRPTALLLLLNYTCYVLAEVCEISSIFALFLCALLCGHYAKHSLSEEARAFSSELSEFIAYVAEAFVFGYFGLTAVAYVSEPRYFSLTLIAMYLGCIIAARFLATLLLMLLLQLMKCGR